MPRPIPRSRRWRPLVLTCSALEGKGIDAVWETVLRHRQCFLGSGELATLRLQQEVDWMWSLVHQGLRQRLEDNRAVREMLPGITKQVARGELSPLAATEQLLDGAFPAEVCRTKGDAYENP